MTITNTATMIVSGRVILWDDYGEDRRGYSFSRLGLDKSVTYTEHYGDGDELKIVLNRDGIESETYVRLYDH